MRLRLLAGTISAGLILGAVPLRGSAAPKARRVSRFDSVTGWQGLRWKMGLTRVRAVLKRLGVQAKHEWQRGQFAGGCVRTDSLRFTWKGWKVTANLRQTLLNHVWMSRDRQTARDVQALRKRLVRRYGSPTRSTPLRRVGKRGVIAWWSGKHTKLSVAVYRLKGRFRIIQTFSRL